jgi:hypothetical protein
MNIELNIHKYICNVQYVCSLCFVLIFVSSNYLSGLVKNKFQHAFSLSGVGFL